MSSCPTLTHHELNPPKSHVTHTHAWSATNHVTGGRLHHSGNTNRMVGATKMNSQSSRSHAVLTITLRQKLPDGSVKMSKLNVADLAGSEKVCPPPSPSRTCFS